MPGRGGQGEEESPRAEQAGRNGEHTADVRSDGGVVRGDQNPGAEGEQRDARRSETVGGKKTKEREE